MNTELDPLSSTNQYVFRQNYEGAQLQCARAVPDYAFRCPWKVSSERATRQASSHHKSPRGGKGRTTLALSNQPRTTCSDTGASLCSQSPATATSPVSYISYTNWNEAVTSQTMAKHSPAGATRNGNRPLRLELTAAFLSGKKSRGVPRPRAASQSRVILNRFRSGSPTQSGPGRFGPTGGHPAISSGIQPGDVSTTLQELF